MSRIRALSNEHKHVITALLGRSLLGMDLLSSASFVEALVHTVTVFEDRVCKVVIKIKWRQSVGC
jgi:hypothetical protein